MDTNEKIRFKELPTDDPHGIYSEETKVEFLLKYIEKLEKEIEELKSEKRTQK